MARRHLPLRGHDRALAWLAGGGLHARRQVSMARVRSRSQKGPWNRRGDLRAGLLGPCRYLLRPGWRPGRRAHHRSARREPGRRDAQGAGRAGLRPGAGLARASTSSMRHVLDDGGMACEDLFAVDLDANGNPDIVAGGRATHNIKIYWNLGDEASFTRPRPGA